MVLESSAFGGGFVWGAAGSAHQTEGAWNSDGKSPSIWDTFEHKRGNIKSNHNAETATDFYNRYPQDIALLAEMNFDALRFSLSWSRILNAGNGKLNPKGIDFYSKLIDNCLEREITPWLTLYHWDLPQVLEDKGGWTNRDMVNWFTEYCEHAIRLFGDRVKHWIIMNEPMSFTSLGYLLGMHAPGKKGMKNFLPAMHHAALCQSIGSRMVKSALPDAQVGTAFSCSLVEPFNNRQASFAAAQRTDVVLNRLFLEPALGLGYPIEDFPFLRRIDKYFLPGDEQLLTGTFDFIGLQYYFRIVVKPSIIPPLYARQVPATKRNADRNSMNMEVFPEGLLDMLKKFAAYPQIQRIIVSETGICLTDKLEESNAIFDRRREDYYIKSLEQVIIARNQGIPVDGFFAWSLTDNFEWNEGYHARFGLVYVDFHTLQRHIKQSGTWFKNFLGKK